jgi:hypothetical protein
MDKKSEFVRNRVDINECLTDLVQRAAEMTGCAGLWCEEHAPDDFAALMKGVKDGTAAAVVMVNIGYTPPHMVAWGSLKDGQFKALLAIPMDLRAQTDELPAVRH